MRLWIIAAVAVLSLQCTGKQITRQNIDRDNVIYWSESRRLTWDDFQGQPIPGGGSVVSEISAQNPASIQKRNVFSKTALTAECFFDKRSSWVDRARATDELLLYNQTIFDIYELYTRRLRQAYDTTSFGLKEPLKIFNELFERNNAAMSLRLKEFRTESKLGSDVEKVRSWSEMIMSEIHALERFKGE